MLILWLKEDVRSLKLEADIKLVKIRIDVLITNVILKVSSVKLKSFQTKRLCTMKRKRIWV